VRFKSPRDRTESEGVIFGTDGNRDVWGLHPYGHQALMQIFIDGWSSVEHNGNCAGPVAEKFWSSHYIQHSAHIAIGREALFNLIKSVPIISAHASFVGHRGAYWGDPTHAVPKNHFCSNLPI
jgi:hypothetical protein